MKPSKEQNVDLGYRPRPHQSEIHRALGKHRFGVIVCHRRFGKTVAAVMECIDRALSCKQPNPRAGYICPYYRQARQVAWQYLRDYTRPIPGVRQLESDLRVDLPNGGRIQLFGGDNPDSLRGQYFDFVVLDEYAGASPQLWGEVIRPALSDRKGGALVMGTPHGRDAFYDLYERARHDPEWHSAIYRADETGILPADELTSCRSSMEPHEFEQEYQCSFTAAVRGNFYGPELEQARKDNRITSVPYDPAAPVFAAFDIGIADATAVWFAQKVGREVHVIDYWELSNQPLIEVFKDLKQTGYVLEQLVLPHDAYAREKSTARSIADMAQSLGFSCWQVPRESLATGIHTVRRIFPGLRFDERKTAAGILSLENYRRRQDKATGEFADIPVHDGASHGADAMRYLALAIDADLLNSEWATYDMETLYAEKRRRSNYVT